MAIMDSLAQYPSLRWAAILISHTGAPLPPVKVGSSYYQMGGPK